MKIAVMAGTPIDTRMGASLLNSRDYREIMEIPISETPSEQTVFQLSDTGYKEMVINGHIDNMKKQGYDVLFVYCNSLSGAVDFKKISEARNIRIITPMEIYQEIALQYGNIAVISANAQGLAGIEKAVFLKNKNIKITGLTLLEMVKEIEMGTSPHEIAVKFNFSGVSEYFKSTGSEAVILGCTHFPYIKEELQKYTEIEIIDPGLSMAGKISDEVL